MRRALSFLLPGLAALAATLTLAQGSAGGAEAPAAAPAVVAEAAVIPQVAPAAGLVESSAFTPRVAFVPAHYLTQSGPAHTHYSCTYGGASTATCERWILANGAVIQGPLVLMQQQWNYLLVWCSISTGGTHWALNTAPAGPWGNTGGHIYCRQPTLPASGGIPWSLLP